MSVILAYRNVRAVRDIIPYPDFDIRRTEGLSYCQAEELDIYVDSQNSILNYHNNFLGKNI